MDVGAHPFVERADGADHPDAVGDDVLAQPAPECADGDDGRRGAHVDLAADDRLQAEHDLRADDDGVDAGRRKRAVRLPAVHDDAQSVGGRCGGAGVRLHAAEWAGADVEAEDDIDLRVVERAITDHRARAAGGRRFFRRLEEEDDGARQLRLHGTEHFGGSHQDGGVHVMTAGMHDARLDAVVDGADGAPVRKVHLLDDR